jgi:hypothetical protein
MVRAERMLESRMIRARIDQKGEAELSDSPQPLHLHGIYDRAGKLVQFYVAMQRVSYYARHRIGLSFFLSFLPYFPYKSKKMKEQFGK